MLELGGGCDEVRNAEVVGARLLLEAAPRHRHYPRLVHQVHTVEEVGLHALRVRLVDELLAEVDAGEAIHAALYLRARHILHVVEGVLEERGLLA